MRVLLLSADEFTEQFDRRIVDLAKCIVENGDQVVIQTIGRTAKFGSINSQKVVQFPRHFKKSSADHARAAFFNETVLETGRNLAREVRLKDIAREIWSKLPTRVKPHIHNIYCKVKFFSSGFLKDVNPKNLADSYFSDSYSFWEPNNQENYDLIIGTDIPSGIAAKLLATESNKYWWYEAHEFATEQHWMKVHHGFTSELIAIEKLLVRDSDIFSCVSEKLVNLMEETFGREKKSIVLHNSTRPGQIESSLQYSLPKPVIDTFNLPENIIMFHGVLSDMRGLSKFVEAFESASIPNWRFLLIGYKPGINLLKALKKAKKSIVLSAVNSGQVNQIVKMSDVVLMPYPAIDINTKFGFANKLGDCIAEKVPFLYNIDLESINEVATKTNTGVPFSWSDLTCPGELSRILKEFEKLSPDWERAESLFGWTNFETNIAEMLDAVRKEILFQQ